MITCLERLATILFLWGCLLMFWTAPVAANNQTWVLGFWNIHGEEFRYKENNSFFRYAENPTPNAFDISGLLPNRFYLEWYLWGKQGLGLTCVGVADEYSMDIFGVSPFKPVVDSSGDSHSPDAWFDMTSVMLTFPRIWFGEDGYWRLGTVAGAGLSRYFMSVSAGYNGERDTASTDGLAFMAGAFLDWGGEGFGARLGFVAMSAWHRYLEYNGRKLNADTHYISRYLDLRWAW